MPSKKKKDALKALCKFYIGLVKAQPHKITSVKFVSFPKVQGPRLYDEVFRGDSSKKEFAERLARYHACLSSPAFVIPSKPIIRLVVRPLKGDSNGR